MSQLKNQNYFYNLDQIADEVHSIYLTDKGISKGCKSVAAVATVEPMIDLRKRVLLLVSELCTNLPAAQLLCTHRCAAHGWHGLG